MDGAWFWSCWILIQFETDIFLSFNNQQLIMAIVSANGFGLLLISQSSLQQFGSVHYVVVTDSIGPSQDGLAWHTILTSALDCLTVLKPRYHLNCNDQTIMFEDPHTFNIPPAIIMPSTSYSRGPSNGLIVWVHDDISVMKKRIDT